MRENDVFELLRVRYPKDQCALLPQVANSTGGHKCRTADAIAMQLWPSRGLSIEGFEIKVSRSDWIRELKDPAKADVIYSVCDYWWIVAPKGVVKDGELPPTWGLYEIVTKGDGHSLKIKVRAPKNESAVEPSRGFIASLLRSLQKAETPENILSAEREKGIEQGIKRGKEIAQSARGRCEKDNEHIRANVERFKEQTGIDIGIQSWDVENIGAAVAAVKNLRHRKNIIHSFMRNVNELVKSAKEVDDEISLLLSSDENPHERGDN